MTLADTVRDLMWKPDLMDLHRNHEGLKLLYHNEKVLTHGEYKGILRQDIYNNNPPYILAGRRYLEGNRISQCLWDCHIIVRSQPGAWVVCDIRDLAPDNY